MNSLGLRASDKYSSSIAVLILNSLSPNTVLSGFYVPVTMFEL